MAIPRCTLQCNSNLKSTVQQQTVYTYKRFHRLPEAFWNISETEFICIMHNAETCYAISKPFDTDLICCLVAL